MRGGIVVVGILCALVLVPTSANAGRKKRAKTRSPASCFRTLDKLGVKYRRVRKPGIALGVVVKGRLGGVRYRAYDKRKLVLDCSLAVSLALAGKTMTRLGIEHAVFSNSYSRRKIAGTNKWSRHSFARAIDVHGFSGPKVGKLTLQQHYEQGLGNHFDCVGRPLTPGGRILKVMDCSFTLSGLFYKVLDPDHDATHYNHFHLSVRPWTERTDQRTKGLWK